MDWNRLDRQQSAEILDHIAMASDPNLFSKSSSEASFKPLPFYQDYMLYRITNYATLPCFSLDFLSDGESYHLLDGSPSPINIVNMKGALYLTESNVLDYADFYLSNIRGDDGDIYLIRDLDNLPFLDSLGNDQKMELHSRHAMPEAGKDTDTGNLMVIADLFYGGTLLKAGIIVDNSGNIEIKPHDMIMSASSGFRNV